MSLEDMGWNILMEGNTKINGDLTITGQIKGGEIDMMGLYEVYVVDTKAKQVVTNDRVIARDEDKAKLSVAAKLNPQSEFPENLEFFVRCIGEWRDE